MSEPYDHRQPTPPRQWQPSGTSRLPMQALGAPPPDLPPQQQYSPGPSGGNRPPERRQRSKGLDYALKGLGLVGIAVVSGFAWWLVRNNPAPPAPPQKPTQQATTNYHFTAFHQPTPADNCAEHATGKVREFLSAHPCQQLIRSLYETKLADGEEAIVSVTEVKLGDPAVASALNTLDRTDGTGNVRDLIEEGVEVPDGPTSLANGGYASKADGGTVIIVLSEYLDPTKDTSQSLNNDPTLKAVSASALQQGIGVS